MNAKKCFVRAESAVHVRFACSDLCLGLFFETITFFALTVFRFRPSVSPHGNLGFRGNTPRGRPFFVWVSTGLECTRPSSREGVVARVSIVVRSSPARGFHKRTRRKSRVTALSVVPFVYPVTGIIPHTHTRRVVTVAFHSTHYIHFGPR